jgi:hypothetical protein
MPHGNKYCPTQATKQEHDIQGVLQRGLSVEKFAV